jgi:hypothetical protein
LPARSPFFALLALIVVHLAPALAPRAASAQGTDPGDLALARFSWSVAEPEWQEQSRLLSQMVGALVEGENPDATLLATHAFDDGRFFRLQTANVQIWFVPLADRAISASEVAAQSRVLSRQLEAMKRGDTRFLALRGTVVPDESMLTFDPDRGLIVLDLLLDQGPRRLRVVQAMVFARDALLRVLIDVPEKQIETSRPAIDAVLASLAVQPTYAPIGRGWRGYSPSLLGAMIGGLVGVVVTVAHSIGRVRRRRSSEG